MKIKIYALRIDGIIQKYRIERKNLKNYVKVSYRKKERRWVWIKKEKKIKLEKKKRMKKPKKPKEIKALKPKRAFKQVWHIKLIYKSPRGHSHNLITELRLETTRFKKLDFEDVKDLVKDNANVIFAVEEEGLPFIYTDLEVGLEDEEEIEATTEDTNAEVVKYSHSL